jgi:hypothetical protein
MIIILDGAVEIDLINVKKKQSAVPLSFWTKLVKYVEKKQATFPLLFWTKFANNVKKKQETFPILL